MKKCMYIAALFGALGCALALQAETTVTMHAPFEFVAAGKTMPAGDYQMDMLTPGVVLIAGLNSGSRVLAMVTESAGSSIPAVVFSESGGAHVLTSVSSSSGTWKLAATAPSHVAVALRSKK